MYMFIIITFVSVCDRLGGGSVAVACGVRLTCSVLLGTVLYCIVTCGLRRLLEQSEENQERKSRKSRKPTEHRGSGPIK